MKLHCQDLALKELGSYPAFLPHPGELLAASHTVLGSKGSTVQTHLQELPLGMRLYIHLASLAKGFKRQLCILVFIALCQVYTVIPSNNHLKEIWVLNNCLLL